MKFTKLFTNTKKESREFDSVNATLLIKGGFVDQTMAGVYTFLPLGLRVLTKIENIVREEMNKIGQEVLMPALSPLSLWEQTDRLTTVDVLFKVIPANEPSRTKNDGKYVLNASQEDVITPIAKKFNVSYKDLPAAVYQIQSKFRNEARPKSGIMRGREFRMKDLYSFHTDEESLKEYYSKSQEYYMNVYNRVGLGELTYLTLASGGDFTKDFSHEFQTKCETGEDTIFYAKSIDKYFNKEIAPSKAPDQQKNNEELREMEKIETVDITGVEALANYLKIPVEKTVKTMIYQTENDVIAAAVRGDYEINEIKLKSILDAKTLKLATNDVVKKVTGAEVGYAGLIGLPKSMHVFIDDSIQSMINFECGANESHTHYINVNWDRDISRPEKFYDLKETKPGDLNPETNEQYEVFKASEVGNIFPLNTKYSEAFNYTYTNENGEQKMVYMGSYGIGTSRLMGVIVEVFHDENGIIWPKSVAPYTAHLVGLNLEDTTAKEKAEQVYNMLQEANIETLYDDRADTSAGEKFADADLIGCPYRIVVSKKTGEQVEVKERSSNESRLMDIKKLIDAVS